MYNLVIKTVTGTISLVCNDAGCLYGDPDRVDALRHTQPEDTTETNLTPLQDVIKVANAKVERYMIKGLIKRRRRRMALQLQTASSVRRQDYPTSR